MAESMQGLHRSHRCTEVSNANIGEKVTVMGWVQKRRNLGSLIFVDLRDRSGILQIVFGEENVGAEGFEKAGTLRSEFVIAVEGTVQKRTAAVNENLKTGDIEVIATSIRVLSEAQTPPFQIEENSKTSEDIRLKYRYLDLRRPDIQRNLMLRSNVLRVMRDFMANEGFLEIETPILCKSTPEGARDYLVPSRIHHGHFYALPQSPQLFKQLLMASGYDRYFQIARCFRDEDLRADRQPEFTQADMELSFVDIDDVIEVNERLLKHLFKEVINVDVEIPFKRMPWQEAMDRFGSDKPDTRFENAIDAGSTAITVEIKEGGISFIRITDNGCGIERDQVAVAFYRHSTSKIRSAEDLLTVKSLGFRGEALSSISAVARVELITKTYDELTGTRYVIEGSKELSNEEIGAPDGTTFIVKDLFYNVPARRKFLKNNYKVDFYF